MAKSGGSGGLGPWFLLGGGAAVLLLALTRGKEVVDMVASAAGGVMTAFGFRPFTYVTDPDIWKAAKGGLQSDPGYRDAGTYDAVIDQFGVASNPRYAKRDGDGNGTLDTYCNIFAQDVMRAMGYELPWGRANQLAQWFMDGRAADEQGWQQVLPLAAQARANHGYPTVAIWENPGGIGHVAVVRPGAATSDGPTIAQAGNTNFNFGHVASGFGRSVMPRVQYFTAD